MTVGAGEPTEAASGLAVYSLLHFPPGRPDRVLPGILPYGARTFLPRFPAGDRLSISNARPVCSPRRDGKGQ
jgi:hypothetical protein